TLGEFDMTVPRLVHLGHEDLGRADRLLLLAAYPPALLVDPDVVAVKERLGAFYRGVMREGIDELVSGRHRRRVGLRDRRHVGAAGFRRGGLFDLVVEIVVLHGGLQSAPRERRSPPCRRGGKARLLKRGSSLRYRRRSWRRSRRAPAPGSTVRNRVKALHGGCFAPFLQPSLEGHAPRPQQSPQLYCRDWSPRVRPPC